jgi:hypothetical protein
LIPAIHVNSYARRDRSRATPAVPGTARMLAPELNAGRLACLDFHASLRNYAIIHRRDRSLSASRAFIDLVRCRGRGSRDRNTRRHTGAPTRA